MATRIEVEKCASEIANILRADSGIPVRESEPKIREALSKESALPSEDELETLVVGLDETGEVPDGLQTRFPFLNETLNSFF